ncbi:MAG: winged helix-turn-helix domain-containing protein [Firmicutes bacterium]|nr:winged helix-turn-helix domain-containing protein [Bacillota bacterium]
MNSTDNKNNFPKPPVFFVGRDREVNKLETHLRDFRLILLTGFPGLGKTTLASVVAKKMAESGANPVLWVKCMPGSLTDSLMRAVTDRAMESGLVKISEDFLPSSFAVVPADKNSESVLSEADARVINTIFHLNRHKVILFVDDFENMDPSSSRSMMDLFKNYLDEARVILVSRTMPEGADLAFPDVFSLHLDFLTPDDCSELVDAISEKFDFRNSDTDNLKKIILQAGGHPYFIKKAAGAFISHNYSLIETRDEDFRKYIDDNFFTSLSEESRGVLALLSLARTPLSKNELLKASRRDDIDEIINQMSKSFVLEFYEPCHYTIHNILRDVVSARITPAEKIELHKVLGELYFEKGSSGSDSALLENLHEAFHHFVEAHESEKCVCVFDLLMKEYPFKGFFIEIISMCDSIIDISDEETRRKMQITRGKFLSLLGRLDEAMAILKTLPDSSDPDTDIIKYRTLGDICFQKLDRASAVFYVKKAIRIAKKSGNMQQFALRACDLANQLVSMHKITQGRKLVELSLKIFGSFGDIYAYPLMPRTEANLYVYDQNTMRGVKILEDLLEDEAQPQSDVWQKNVVYYPQLGDYHADLGMFDRAFMYADKSIEIARRYHSAVIECHSLLTKSKILVLSKAGEDRENVLHQALKLSKSREMQYYHLHSLYLQAFFFANNGQYEESMEFFDRAVKLSQECNSLIDEAQVRIYKGIVCLISGDYKNCISEMKKALPVYGTNEGEAKLRFHIYMILAIAHYSSGRLDDFMADCQNMTDLAENVPKIYIQFASFILAITGETEWLGRELSKEKIKAEIEKLHINVLVDYGSTFDAIRLFEKNMGDFVVSVSRKKNFCNRELLASFTAERSRYDLYYNYMTEELYEKSHTGMIQFIGKKNQQNLLALMMGNAGQVFTADQIFSLVWEEPYEHELNYHSVKVAISRLRSIIEPDPKNPKYIKTHRSGRDSTTWYFDENSSFMFVSEKTV